MEHECKFPSEPDADEEFACYDCRTLWQWNHADNEWEAIGEAWLETDLV